MSNQPLLIVTRHYAPEPTGSAPVLAEMAQWLARNGYDVEVLTVRPSYPERRITPGYERGQKDRTVENGVKVRRIAAWLAPSKKLLARALPELKFFVDLVMGRLVGRFRSRATVVSLCPSIFTVMGALTLVKAGGVHVAVVHDIPSGLGAALGLDSSKLTARLLRRIERWTLNHADQIVTLSEGMANQLRAIGVTRPIMVIPPNVDTVRIRPMPRPAGAPPTVMYSGNLGRKQGLNQLVDLAKVMRDKAPHVRILIRGEGTGRDDLAESLTAEGLDNVRLEPLAPLAALAESLAEGDVHLVPQLGAGADFAVPSKVFAIMAAGRTLVATASEGSPLARLAADSQAFICTPLDNPEAFADAVIALLADASRRAKMGENARDYVEANASTHACMTKFQTCLDGRPAKAKELVHSYTPIG
jgi:colanic acid biosynthesis glycosyl transferase WcaI